MSSGWNEVMLNNIVTKLGDGLHGTPKYTDNGKYHFINGNNLTNGRITFNEKTKRVDQSQFEKYKKELTNRTILVSINGTIGNVAFYGGEKVVLGKSACYFNLIDEVDKGFVRYVLESRIFQAYIESFSTGTTIKNVSLKTMRGFKFNLPPLPEQKAIAHILGKLDDKIELNRQMNQTLEEMAQALFKSWFVDFDPVLDNAMAAGNKIPEALQAMAEKRSLVPDEQKLLSKNPERASKFPSSFEYNETLGKWIPEGWEVKNFEELVNAKQGKYLPKKEMADEQTEAFNYPVWGGNGIRGYSKKAIYMDKVIVLTCRGSNCGLLNLTKNASWVSNIGIACESKIGSIYFAFQALSRTSFDDTISGSAQPQITYTALKSKTIPISFSDSIVGEYSKIIDDFYSQIFGNQKQTETLIQLGDTLLPQLISGKVRVPEGFVERFGKEEIE